MEKKAAPKPHKKDGHEQGIGLTLVGSVDKTLKQILPAGDELQWAIEQIEQQGPPHKQVQNALLFRQLASLMKAVEASTGEKFTMQKGTAVTSTGPEHEIAIPAAIPSSVLKGLKDTEAVLEKATKGPEHEILMYSLTLQVLSWAEKSIKAAAKKQ